MEKKKIGRPLTGKAKGVFSVRLTEEEKIALCIIHGGIGAGIKEAVRRYVKTLTKGAPKLSILLLLALNLASCSMLRPEYLVQMVNTGDAPSRSPASPEKFKYDWGLDKSNQAQMAKFNSDKKECEEKAFNLRALGSKFGEYDLALGCMERRGYKLSRVAVK